MSTVHQNLKALIQFVRGTKEKDAEFTKQSRPGRTRRLEKRLSDSCPSEPVPLGRMQSAPADMFTRNNDKRRDTRKHELHRSGPASVPLIHQMIPVALERGQL